MTFEDNITSNESLPWLNFTTCLLVALGVVVRDGFSACLLVAAYLLANRHKIKRACKKRAAESKDDKQHGDGDEVCANCRSKGGNDVGAKLKDCAACLLVKYCGVDCQRAHRKQHKKACRQRAAELKDERLYGLGHERPEGDFCPLCTLPIPLPTDEHSKLYACCMKKVCDGCAAALYQRGMGGTCPFCRTAVPKDDAASLAMIQNRVDAGDADATHVLGTKHFHGQFGLEKDVQRAIELWTDAAVLGSMHAHFELGLAYNNGIVVQQDKARAVEHWQHAAMKGHVMSRHGLGVVEANKGNYNLAMKHLLISSKMGFKISKDMVKVMFSRGQATNEQYAEAMKGYQVAVEG